MKKKIFSILLIALISMGIVACGNTTNSVGSAGEKKASVDFSKFDPANIKTMADFLKFKDEENYNFQTSTTEENYVVVLNINDTYYRAVANLPHEVYDELFSIEDFDEREKKMAEVNASLPVERLENLSEKIPPQSELDKYIGKTCGDLENEGWSYHYYNLQDMEAGMDYKLFSYIVKFDYDGPQMENTDDFDFFKEFKDLKIKSVTFEGVGDATNLEY